MSKTPENIAIRIDGVSKYYDIGQTHSYRTFREALTKNFKRIVRPFGKSKSDAGSSEDKFGFWALKDVSLDIRRGEKIGILGSNGAGKSTLAKIVSRVTQPTEGSVTGYGRVASLLEVGAGFHPELTGRENIYLNGSIMGMSKKEIDSKFDEIVEFSEIKKFLDMPVKRYSSGMYVKLAFSVAVHLDSEIVVIDEVLSVGDAKFQKKCLTKIEETTAGERTVVFISHNMAALQNLCSRAVHIEKGQIVADGIPSQVIASYLRLGGSSLHRKWAGDDRPGSSHVKLNAVSVCANNNPMFDTIYTSDDIKLDVVYENLTAEFILDINIQLINEHGVLVFDMSRYENRDDRSLLCTGIFQDICVIPGSLLNDGGYSIDLRVYRNHDLVFSHSNIINFSLVDDDDRRDGWYGKWAGVVRPRLSWKTKLLTKN